MDTMGRTKRCRICEEILFCQRCGTRQSPETPLKSNYSVRLTPEQKEKLQKKADEAGMSVASYLRAKLLPEKREP